MARFKPIHKGLKLIPVDFDRQVIPGSFEHALCYLVDHELDLSAFHVRYKNALEGAPAFHPAVLIKIILLAYSRGLIHSRMIEAACRENVLFIAVSGDSQPHCRHSAGCNMTDWLGCSENSLKSEKPKKVNNEDACLALKKWL